MRAFDQYQIGDLEWPLMPNGRHYTQWCLWSLVVPNDRSVVLGACLGLEGQVLGHVLVLWYRFLCELYTDCRRQHSAVRLANLRQSLVFCSPATSAPVERVSHRVVYWCALTEHGCRTLCLKLLSFWSATSVFLCDVGLLLCDRQVLLTVLSAGCSYYYTKTVPLLYREVFVWDFLDY